MGGCRAKPTAVRHRSCWYYPPRRLAAGRRNPFDQNGREIIISVDSGKVLRQFTNDLTSPAEAITAVYKERWLWLPRCNLCRTALGLALP